MACVGPTPKYAEVFHNWMFANTSNGAQASAVLYSLVETAKANGLTPFDYIKHLLDELPKQPDCIDHLLPWNVALAQLVI